MCEHHHYTGRAVESRLLSTNILLGLSSLSGPVSEPGSYRAALPVRFWVCWVFFSLYHLLGLLSK